MLQGCRVEGGEMQLGYIEKSKRKRNKDLKREKEVTEKNLKECLTFLAVIEMKTKF